jgi:hypothetical protein
MSVGNKSERRLTSVRGWARRNCVLHGRPVRARSPFAISCGWRRSVLRDSDPLSLLRQLEAENAELCRQAAHLALEICDLTKLTEGRLGRGN